MAAGLRSFTWTTCLAILGIAPVFGQPQTALPPIKTVDYDRRGAFRVNGKPFFPIALYDAPLDDQTLRELRDFGFNVLACDAKACASLPAKGFYGASHADKKIDDLAGVFMGVGMDSPALNFKKDLLKQVAEANAKTSASVPGRPIMNGNANLPIVMNRAIPPVPGTPWPTTSDAKYAVEVLAARHGFC